MAEASVRFNNPSAYQTWSVGSHAVDDNNRIRQDVGDLTRTWTAQEPLKKHMLTCFAFAESSAFGYWNYMHKSDGADLTKKDWRKAIIRALCEANTQGAARVRAQPNFPSRECREGLRAVPEFSTWNEQTGQFEPTLRSKLVRWRLCACVLLVAAWLIVAWRDVAWRGAARCGGGGVGGGGGGGGRRWRRRWHLRCCIVCFRHYAAVAACARVFLPTVQPQRRCQGHREDGSPCPRAVRTYCPCSPKWGMCQLCWGTWHRGQVVETPGPRSRSRSRDNAADEPGAGERDGRIRQEARGRPNVRHERQGELRGGSPPDVANERVPAPATPAAVGARGQEEEE